MLAVVFGAVAGGTMFLVYQGASAYWAQLDTEGHGEETGLADSQTGGSHIFDAQQSTDAKETLGAAGSAGTQAAAADPSGELPEVFFRNGSGVLRSGRDPGRNPASRTPVELDPSGRRERTAAERGRREPFLLCGIPFL